MYSKCNQTKFSDADQIAQEYQQFLDSCDETETIAVGEPP